MKLDILNKFSKNTHITNLMKILPEGAELFHANEWTDESTYRKPDITKLLVAFRNFANAPKNT